MPVNDIIGMVMSCIEIGLQVGQLVLIKWILFDNGWIYLGRLIGFRIDLRIVNYIGVFYDYFMKMLDRDIFNKELTNEIVTNIYVFIGVIMVFRLMMLLMKYLINPDLTADSKLGVTSLIRRVIVGCVGILFIPTIFDLGLELQSAIIKDNLIQKILIPKDLLPRITRVQQKGGKYVATYIQAGFVTPSETCPASIKNDYDTGIKNGDLSVLKDPMGEGFLGDVDNYSLNYVPIVSTLVLAYALMQMAKYCLDLAVRCFRLLLYKILTPVAMIEYMIKGADDGVFKKWKQAIISTYVSLFIRVMALWFVIFVTALMQFDPNDKYIANSLLDDPSDSLLRAFIIVALLGFMMDLPKLVGAIFDLDLEQQGGADGVFKSITGLVKNGYLGGLGAAGAAVGSIGATALGGAKSIGSLIDNKNKAKNDEWKNNHPKLSGLSKALTSSPLSKSMAAQRAATTKTLMGLSPVTKAWYDGASGVYGAGTGAYDKKVGSNDEKERHDTERAHDEQEARENADRVARQVESNQQREVQTIANQVAQNNPKMDAAEIAAHVKAQIGFDDSAITALIASLQSRLAGGATMPIKAVAKEIDDATGGGHINSITTSLQSVVGERGVISAANVNGAVTTASANLDATLTAQATASANNAVNEFPRGSDHGYVNGAPVVVQEPVPPVTVASSGGTPPVSVSGSAPTIDLAEVKINVTGKAEANYNGGLETNITGPAKTTYNGTLETEFKGDVKSYYDKGFEVDVGGPVKATYYDDINVDVGGSVNTNVQQDVNTTVHQDVNNTVEGSVTNTVRHDVDNLVEGNVTNIVEQNVDNLVEGNVTNTIKENQSTVVNKDSITQINGKSTTVVNKDADVHVNGNVNIDAGKKNKKKDDA